MRRWIGWGVIGGFIGKSGLCLQLARWLMLLSGGCFVHTNRAYMLGYLAIKIEFRLLIKGLETVYIVGEVIKFVQIGVHFEIKNFRKIIVL
jgi:hypothetical protein